MSSKSNKLYEFGEFRLDVENPGLWRGEELVLISPKALEALILLVENRGEIVSREELLAKIWKDTFVEEANINYTISLLRKALGDKNFIQTVPRRGYRFTAEVKLIEANREAASNELETDDDSVPVKPEPIKETRKDKNRPIFLTAALASLCLLVLLAFSWQGATAPVLERRAEEINSRERAESLESYKRGKLILGDKDVENRDQKALDEFQRAVTLDPTSALGYAGLAEGFISKANSQVNERSVEFFAKAKAAADKAFSIDENLSEAYLARGWVRRNGYWDWSGAEEDFRRAIELNPNDPVGHYRYSQLLANLGRHAEARSEIKKAATLDPLSEIILNGHFPLLEAAGEYEEALKIADEYLRSNSQNPFARRSLGTFQYHTGDYLKVIENGEIALAKSPGKKPFAWLSLLSAAYQKTGQTEKAEELLKELEIQSYSDKKALYSLAMNYAEAGRIEEALTTLEKCFEIREGRIMWIKVEPRFANLRNEPRFQQILGKMRLN